MAVGPATSAPPRVQTPTADEKPKQGTPTGKPGLNAGGAINTAYNVITNPLTHKDVAANGPGFEELGKIIKAEDSVAGGGFLKDMGKNLLKPTPKNVGKAGVTMLKYLYGMEGKAVANGERRNDAIIRDGFSQATLRLANDGVFPPGYIPDRAKHLQAGNKVADEISLAGEKKLGAEEFRGLKAAVSQSAREGQAAAVNYDVRSEKQLEELKKRDEAFAGRFNDDIAFREGVLSMVWLAQNRPADFDMRRQLQTSSQAGSAGVRG